MKKKSELGNKNKKTGPNKQILKTSKVARRNKPIRNRDDRVDEVDESDQKTIPDRVDEVDEVDELDQETIPDENTPEGKAYWFEKTGTLLWKLFRECQDSNKGSSENMTKVEPLKKTKRGCNVNHGKVNQLTAEEIDYYMDKFFKGMYISSPRKMSYRVSYEVPYIIEDDDGNLWANPYAFSLNTGGYVVFNIPPKHLERSEPGPPKSNWGSKISIHELVWRWANDYKTIPEDMDVSHITGQVRLVNPNRLKLERPSVNRARTACQQEKWYEKVIRKSSPRRTQCPHHKHPCRDRLVEPTDADYKREGRKPPGLPSRKSDIRAFLNFIADSSPDAREESKKGRKEAKKARKARKAEKVREAEKEARKARKAAKKGKKGEER